MVDFLKKLAVAIVILLLFSHNAKITIINMKKTNEKDRVLFDVYESLRYAVMMSENESKPVKDWEWQSTDAEIAAQYILQKRILPYVTNHKECKSNSLDCVSGFSYLNKDDYEHINYRRGGEYVRSLFGIYDAHIALKLSGECKRNNKYSVCGIIILDINNNDLPNTMGYDVFKFAFYGDGMLLPFGIYWDRKDIESECQPDMSGESCAAKIMLDGWTMKKGGDNPYFIYKKTTQ